METNNQQNKVKIPVVDSTINPLNGLILLKTAQPGDDMPETPDNSVAAVYVRFFGISGLLRHATV